MKTLRLKKDEKKAVKAKWKDNPVFAAFYEICKENSRTMVGLEYEPEEVFYAAFIVLDNVKKKDEKWHDYISGLGERLRNMIRAGDDTIADESLWRACCEILTMSAIVILLASENCSVPYNLCLKMLMREIDPKGVRGMTMQSEMMDRIPDEMLKTLSDYSAEYINSEERISEEISTLIENDEAVEELSAKEDGLKEIGVLQSEEAEKIFKKLRRASILDKKNMPLSLSNSKKGALAMFVANKLGIKNVWKEFSIYWGVSSENIRSNYNKNRNGNVIIEFEKRLKTILNT